MNILTEIVSYKKESVAEQKTKTTVVELKESPYFHTATKRSLSKVLRTSGKGVIAEFKRRSPSKGEIKPNAQILSITKSYEKAGAAGLSVLTDAKYFGGKAKDIFDVRDRVSLPILRKEFIVDEFQVYESKAIGADLILLIATILSQAQIEEYTELAHSLGLEVLLEIHSEREFDDKYYQAVDILGVNNRNLDTLTVDINTSIQLKKVMPGAQLAISESGFSHVEKASEVLAAGYSGLLIGEHFMTQPDPGEACREFIEGVQT